MADISKRSGLPRRALLTSLAAAPMALTAGVLGMGQTATNQTQLNEIQLALKRGSGTRLVILGSGAGPNATVPGRSRYMTSHLMLSEDRAYVLDCGLGVTNQFARTGIPFTAVHSIFITHHHPDHNV